MRLAYASRVVFQELAYLSWIEGRPDAVAHDLASSDLRPATHPTDPVPPRLRDRADPPSDVPLDELVAAEYDVTPEHVLVTAGASNANALAFAATTQPDAPPADATTARSGVDNDRTAKQNPSTSDDRRNADSAKPPRILVEKPGYEPLTSTPEGFGARVDRFRRPAGVLDPARVRGATTDVTSLVVVTDRHNPTGRRADRDALDESAAAARDVGARLLVDEVYAPFASTQNPTSSPTGGAFGAPTTAGTPGVVVTGSLTKFLGFGGLRVGWLIADPAFVRVAERIQRHLPSVAAPSVALARRVLHHRESLADERRERIARNHELLADFAARRDDLAGHVHDGSTYALLAHDAVDGTALAERALDAGVLVVPGRFFDRPDAARISLGRPTDQASDALDALAIVLDDLE